jgi:hypothetical protein
MQLTWELHHKAQHPLPDINLRGNLRASCRLESDATFRGHKSFDIRLFAVRLHNGESRKHVRR